jgi:hypothetical protein
MKAAGGPGAAIAPQCWQLVTTQGHALHHRLRRVQLHSHPPTPLGYRSVGGGSTAWPIDLRRRLRWGGCSPRGHKDRQVNMPDPSSPTPFAIPWPSASMVIRGAPSAFVCRRRLGAVTHPARSRYRGNQPLPGMRFTNALHCWRWPVQMWR